LLFVAIERNFLEVALLFFPPVLKTTVVFTAKSRSISEGPT
jgi:hypothetical protein